MKKVVFLFLCLTLAFSFTASAMYETLAADELFSLGLFNGTGVDETGNPIYALERTMTRQEALTLFIRLIGQENEAVSGTWETPFTDVDEWAKPYVGFAYEKGYTKGTSETAFGAKSEVTAEHYLTFVLRALGYSDETDFSWEQAPEFAKTLAITNPNNAEIFTRGDAVLASQSALKAPMKESETTLFEMISKRFEGRPDGANRVAFSGEGYLFYWFEGDVATVAYYGADDKLLDRYDVDLPGYDPRISVLKKYELGSYFYGVQGVYELKDGRLLKLTDRPTADMTFLRYGAESSAPVILTFDRKTPMYAPTAGYAGETILEVKPDGGEDIFLDGTVNHGMRITSIWKEDSTVCFEQEVPIGPAAYHCYRYALLRKYDGKTNKYRPEIVVMDFESDYRYDEPGWSDDDPTAYKTPYLEKEQKRLNDLGIGIE